MLAIYQRMSKSKSRFRKVFVLLSLILIIACGNDQKEISKEQSGVKSKISRLGEIEENPSKIKRLFTIQVAASRHEHLANDIADSLSRKSYAAYVSPRVNSDSIWYRVRIGRFKDRKKAESMLRILNKEFNDAYIVTIKSVEFTKPEESTEKAGFQQQQTKGSSINLKKIKKGVHEHVTKDNVSRDDLPKTITNSISMNFVYISPGSFMMGSPPDEPGRWGDETRHRVTLSRGRYMQSTEVTQEQWAKIMDGNPSTLEHRDDCPVETVSWNDVQEFIRRLNQREQTNKYRLPSEAEWEYSCRAGSDATFANGVITENGCGYDPNLDEIGWYCGNADNKTHQVAQKTPNAWGLYDMHGNVWEWCHDLYGTYSSGPVVDPIGPTTGSKRVIRGGSWNCSARRSGSANRDWDTPDSKFNGLGFRVVKDIQKSQTSFFEIGESQP